MSYSIVLVDLTKAKLADLDALVSDADCLVRRDYARDWGLQEVSFRIASEPGDRADNEIASNFRDDLPEAPSALAYHQETNGIPDIEIGAGLATSLKQGTESVWVAFLHELLEMLGDPGGNQWADSGRGYMVAKETVDVVQNTGRESDSGATLPNFLLPSYFMPNSKGPWDFQGLMSAPDDVSNGYEIRASTPTGMVEVGSMMVPYSQGRKVEVVGNLTEWQKQRKNNPWSRGRRRGVIHPVKRGGK